MADSSGSLAYSADPTLYLYTSLTAGSSHIITATSRLETILKANKIPFRAIDVATDEKARMLWGRRSKGKKLPGLVRYGMIVGDLAQIEEWNEFGELKMQIGSSEAGGNPATETAATPATAPPVSAPAAQPAPTARPTSTAPHIQIADTPSRTSSAASTKDKEEQRYTSALRQAGEEAAAKAKENTRAKLGIQPMSSLDRAEEAVAQTAASSDEPTTTKDYDKEHDTKEGSKAEEKAEKDGGEYHDEDSRGDNKKDKKDEPETEEKGEKGENGEKEMKEEKEEKEAKEAKEEEDEGAYHDEESTAKAAESLKAAQRRASVQADIQGLGGQNTAAESTSDLQATKTAAGRPTEHRREAEVSATSAAEIEEVAKDLRRGSLDEAAAKDESTGEGMPKRDDPAEKASK